MAAEAASATGSYRRSIDLLRFVACFGIVWDHARAPFADIGYLALAIFLLLTSFLAVGSFERSKGGAFLLSRAARAGCRPVLRRALCLRLILGRDGDHAAHPVRPLRLTRHAAALSPRLAYSGTRG